ncbi:MAG: hypothetical protein RLZZ536_3652 [Planctomycetota bacterium]
MARLWSFRAAASVRKALRKPPPRSGNLQAAGCRGQVSGWKARATCIRAHSCPFVVHRHPCVSFASSRLRVRPTARKPRSSQRQSADSRLQRADLGLESPSYLHSWFIRVHSASGGVSPLVTALPSVLWLRNQRRAAPSPSGETELSRHPRHATAVDGDSDLPFPHTRDAAAEGMYSKIMLIKRRGGGFRSRNYFTTAIFFYCCSLSLEPR